VGVDVGVLARETERLANRFGSSRTPDPAT